MHDASIVNFERLLSYHHWNFGWYSFLELLDGFCFPLCGTDSLDTFICDATFLSFRQELCSSLKDVHPSVRRSSDSRINGRQVTLMFGFDNFVGNPFALRNLQHWSKHVQLIFHYLFFSCSPK